MIRVADKAWATNNRPNNGQVSRFLFTLTPTQNIPLPPSSSSSSSSPHPPVMIIVPMMPPSHFQSMGSSHRRHPSAPPMVLVQPTHTPGLLSISKQSPRIRQQQPQQRQQHRQPRTPKSKPAAAVQLPQAQAAGDSELTSVPAVSNVEASADLQPAAAAFAFIQERPAPNRRNSRTRDRSGRRCVLSSFGRPAFPDPSAQFF
jgi:hypothetical protein